MRKALLVLALIFGMTGLAQAQQKQSLSAAASTCTTTGTSCLIYLVDASSGGATFTVSANASGNTLQFEATGDGGQTWVALNATPSNSTTAATSTTGTGTWQANVAGYTGVRIRMSTLSGGTSTVSIITSLASARSGGGGGGGGVTSFSGDGTVITNSASTGAVTATIGGTSGGVPYFNTATSWASSSALTNNAAMFGGGAGSAPKVDASITTNGSGSLGVTTLNFANTGAIEHNGAYLFAGSAPTIAAAGCGGSGASIPSNNGTAAFKVNVGTSNTGTCTISLTNAGGSHVWQCFASDITTTSTAVSQTKMLSSTASQAVLQNYTDISGTGAWTDSDVLIVNCTSN